MPSGSMPRARLHSSAGRHGVGGGCRTGCAGPWHVHASVRVFLPGEIRATVTKTEEGTTFKSLMK